MQTDTALTLEYSFLLGARTRCSDQKLSWGEPWPRAAQRSPAKSSPLCSLLSAGHLKATLTRPHGDGCAVAIKRASQAVAVTARPLLELYEDAGQGGRRDEMPWARCLSPYTSPHLRTWDIHDPRAGNSSGTLGWRREETRSSGSIAGASDFDLANSRSSGSIRGASDFDLVNSIDRANQKGRCGGKRTWPRSDTRRRPLRGCGSRRRS